MVDIPDSGLYTLSVFGTAAGGQRWLADGCRTCLICPNVDEAARWRDVLSGVFPKGKHYFSATLGPDTSVERLKIEQKKDTPADYLATLERLGLALGAPGPVTREKADEARRFLEGRRAQRQRELCGDILRPGTLVAEITSASNTTGWRTAGAAEAATPAEAAATPEAAATSRRRSSRRYRPAARPASRPRAAARASGVAR